MDNPKASTRTSLGGLGISAASITSCNNNNHNDDDNIDDDNNTNNNGGGDKTNWLLKKQTWNGTLENTSTMINWYQWQDPFTIETEMHRMCHIKIRTTIQALLQYVPT